MNTLGDAPNTPLIRVRQGESIKLQGGGHNSREVKCDDIAKMALAIHHHSYFFSNHRDLSINFCRDINGSGDQLLEIERNRNKGESQLIISVVFTHPPKNKDHVLYRAELIKDRVGGREFAPDRGECDFGAKVAVLQIDWNSSDILQLRRDIERLSNPPETLTAWINADLTMFVTCVECGWSVVRTRSDLTRYAAARLTLKDLKSKLKCSKCGRRQARVEGALI